MKKRIMIDMDDVITDGSFKAQIENYIGEKIDTNKTGYYMQNALGDRKEEFFRKGPLNMYDGAILKDDAYEVIKNLNEVYELYIVTSYVIPDAHYQEGNHLKYKMEFLQKHLPFLTTEQIIFIANKDLINFDILRKVYRYEEKEYVYGCKFVNLDEKEEEMLRQQVYHTNYVALKKIKL